MICCRAHSEAYTTRFVELTIQLKHAHIFGGSLYPVLSFFVFLGVKFFDWGSSYNPAGFCELFEYRPLVIHFFVFVVGLVDFQVERVFS